MGFNSIDYRLKVFLQEVPLAEKGRFPNLYIKDILQNHGPIVKEVPLAEKGRFPNLYIKDILQNHGPIVKGNLYQVGNPWFESKSRLFLPPPSPLPPPKLFFELLSNVFVFFPTW